MGVAADEELRFVFRDQGFDPGIIAGWVAPDMGHEDLHFFAGEEQVLGKVGADLLAIDIAVDTAQGFEFTQFISKGHIPEIAPMPDLIAVLEMMRHLFIQEAVGV